MTELTTDALWTRFVRCWRELKWCWCVTCNMMVDPGALYYPAHYHGDYFD